VRGSLLPTLSVVVPTRNRAQTLRHCLRTITSQTYPNLQIVVSDNASADNTAEVVSSFADPRITYLRTPRSLSMTDNWNFGLSAATGDFITFIGDDDGFIPDGIATGMRLLLQTGRPALTWRKLDYHWPDHAVPETRNLVHGQSEPFVFEVDGMRKLSLVLAFREAFHRLPCVYNSIVKMDLIRRVQKESFDGSFFGGCAPDVYSAIVLGPFVGKYLELKFPLTINGASGRSNGSLGGLADKNTEQQALVDEFFALESRRYSEDIAVCPSAWSMVMGEFLIARERVSLVRWPRPRWRRYIKALIREAHGSAKPESVLASARHTAHRRNLRLRLPDTLVPTMQRFSKRGHTLEGFIILNPELVSDVAQVASLFGGLLPAELHVERSPVGYYVRKFIRQSLCAAKDLYRLLYSK
jgi:glycosyltransferase involved in cell wall biosynthesis